MQYAVNSSFRASFCFAISHQPRTQAAAAAVDSLAHNRIRMHQIYDIDVGVERLATCQHTMIDNPHHDY